MYFPAPVVQVDLSEHPPDEDWSKFTSKDGVPYDPLQKLECEILRCFLDHGLPEGSFEAPQPSQANKRKRKTVHDDSDSAPQPEKRRKSSTPRKTSTPTQETVVSDNDLVSPPPSKTTKKRGRPKKQPTTDSTAHSATTEARIAQDGKASVTPQRNLTPIFRQPRALPDFINSLVDSSLKDSNSDSESELEVLEVVQPTRPGQTFVAEPARRSLMAEDTFAPGEVISPKTLRGLRAGSSLLRQPQAPSIAPSRTTLASKKRPTTKVHEVIHLT